MTSRQRLLVAGLSLAAATAWANTPEDVYGVSARTNAMGGAGTALPGDHAATHYNPAGLASCRDDLVAVDVSTIVHSLDFSDQRGATEELEPRESRDQTRFMFGVCQGLPFDLGLGLIFGFGTPGGVSIDQRTPDQQPQYVMYGQNHEQASIGLGLGWRPTPWLSVGAGFSALVHTELPLIADIPVTVPDPAHPGQNKPVSFNVSVGMGGRLAPRLGVLVTPFEWLRVGIAYRRSLYHALDIDTDIEVQTSLVNVKVPLHVDLLSWFSPSQWSLGVSGEPFERLTLDAEATWYGFGSLADNTYPFLNIRSTGGPGSPAEALVFPTVENPGWQDSLALRFGAELRLGRTALRAGFAHRSAAVDDPSDSNVNLLDGSVLTGTFGAGVHFGREAPRPGQLPDPPPRRRIRLGKYDLPALRASLEAFVRVDKMPGLAASHTSTGPADPVPEKRYEYGGSVWQLGLTGTVGW